MTGREWIRREREGLRDLAVLVIICLGIAVLLSACGSKRDDTWLGVKRVYERANP